MNTHPDAQLRLWKNSMTVGRMAYESGSYMQAVRHFRKALNLIDEAGLPDALLSPTLVNLAKTLGTINQFPEAEMLLERALKLDERESVMDDDLKVALIEDFHQLSLLYWRAGKLRLSESALLQSLNILTISEISIPDELRAKLMKHRAVLTELAGDLKKSDREIDQAIQFIHDSPSLGKFSSIYGDCLMVKVMILVREDKYKDAVSLYHDASQVLACSRGDMHFKNLNLLEDLEKLALSKGLTRAAENLKKEAKHVKEILQKREQHWYS